MREFPSDCKIPRLSANDIELKAEEVIELFVPQALERPTFTAITTIVKETSKKYGIRFESGDLGVTSGGQKVLGRFQFSPRAIFIDSSVVGTDRHAFTLAHEFGHLVLHRHLVLTKRDYQITDTERDFVTGKKILKSTRDWIEWQANRFAAAVLMPRATLRAAVVAAQRLRGIVRNLGIVYLDNQPANFRDFIGIQTALAELYQVNRTNVRHRLGDLGLLVDHRDKDTSHVSELLMAEG
jgi:hypothetical protein